MRLPFSAQAAAQAVPAALLTALLALAPAPQVALSAPPAIVAPAASAESPPAEVKKAAAMSKQEVEKRLSAIPVIALVNEDDAPFFTGREGLTPLAFFYLDPTDALRELQLLKKSQPDAKLKLASLSEVYFPLVRGSESKKGQDALGGLLRVRPSRREVVQANRALQFQAPEGSLLPTSLSENKGQVPVFYSEKIAFEGKGSTAYPFFFRKEDLDAAFIQLQAKEGAPEAPKPQKGGKEVQGLPVGLTRVATLDGIVKQMLGGEVDLRDAVFVGSPQAAELSKQIVSESQ